jgi:hypothetical protein
MPSLLPRRISTPSLSLFWLWTGFWWGLVGVFAVLFYVGHIDFVTSTKYPLYGISVWLNAWLLAFVPQSKQRTRLDIYNDCVQLWLLSYLITNLMWEVPWVLLSPHIFTGLNSLPDVEAMVPYMRANPLNMYYWVLSSFSSVDMRTVNHDPTFYSLEICAFGNVLLTVLFFYLVRVKSPLRFVLPLATCGIPAAATFIFSFSEVFAGYINMSGGLADTLLALVWTQYQYIIFPLVAGYLSYPLLQDDWQRSLTGDSNTAKRK